MYELELKAVLKAVKDAEKVIKEIYATNFEVEIKSDNSPVTKADKKSDELIRKELGSAFPNIGFLTEESIDTKERLKEEDIWIVDPVDGTKEFVSRNGEFCTNVALCHNHEIVLGVINVPILEETFYAIKGQGAYKLDKDGNLSKIHVSKTNPPLKAVRSISFFNNKEAAFYKKNQALFEGNIKPLGSALKFCRIAEGKADFFLRLSSGTKEWDVAAGDLILSEAGGVMVEPNGQKMKYNRVDVYNRNGYVLANKKENLFLDKLN